MGLERILKSDFNRGVYVFSNGQLLYIVEMQYSYDTTYWEDEFKPYEHPDPRNATLTIPGHKYRRVRHSGDDYFQTPEYIVAEDGRTPILYKYNDGIYIKYEGDVDSSGTKLVDLSEIKGEKGLQGDTGMGFTINSANYWYDKPDCTTSLLGSGTCRDCWGNTTNATTGNTYLFLSLGDGKYIIQGADVGRYRSCDGTTFLEVVLTDVGNYTRYMADDALGTGAIDYRTQDTLGTRGKVYYCDGISWKQFLNVSIPYHKLSPSAQFYIDNQEGYYMDSYVSDETPQTNPIYDTIEMTEDYKLVVRKDSIEPAHLKDGSFGDGLDEGVVDPIEGTSISPIKVDKEAFSGYGLKTYTSNADTEDDIQVDVDVLIGDGLISYDDNTNNVDGEDRKKFAVDARNIVDGSLSGLETFANTDTYYDIRVKVGDALFIDTDGLNVLVDDLSLDVNVDNELVVKTYVAGNDGILPAHLNNSANGVANGNKGMELSNTTGLAVKLSTDHIALGFDALGVKVIESGIRGWHLNADVCDTDSGLYFDTGDDVLRAKLKTGGGLDVDTDGLFVDPTDISWLGNYVVKKIEIGAGDVLGDVVMQGDTSSDNYVHIEVTLAGQTITVAAETQLANLTSLIDGRIVLAGIGAHNHAIADVTGLQAALDAKVDQSVQISNIMIATNGLFIRNASNTAWAKVICSDDNFSLDTDKTEAPIL